MNASENMPAEAETPIEDTVVSSDAKSEKKINDPEIQSTDTINNCQDDSGKLPEIDYAELARSDMQELIAEFPYLRGKTSVAELDNPLRYAALRDLGLTPREAYLATGAPISRYDNRSHLRSAVPSHAAASENMLDARGLEAARELFAGLSDREIQRLYKKVSK